MSYIAKDNIPKTVLKTVGRTISSAIYNELDPMIQAFYRNVRPVSVPCSNHAFEVDDEIESIYSNNISCKLPDEKD